MGMKTRHFPTLAVALFFSPTAFAQSLPETSGPPTVVAGAQLTLDGLANVAGGVDRGGRVLSRLDGSLQLDGAGIGRDWLDARLDLGVMNGTRASGGLVGDIQGVDNIEGVRAFRIFNAWVGAKGGPGGIEAGVIDLNSQFDIHNVSAPFVNSSFGTGPSLSHSGLNGPSIYPNSGLGIVVWADDTGHAVRYRLGVFDGVPNDPDRPDRTTFTINGDEGALVIGEVDKTWGTHGRVAVGGWGYTARLPRLRNPDRRDHSSIGGFVTVEDTLATLGNGRRVDGWVRGGLADASFNVVSSYVGGGAVLHGIARADASDTIGFGIAHADLSRGQDVQSGAVVGADTTGSGTETTFEVTYQNPLDDRFVLQPDVQYVVSPGGRSDLGNAVVVALRIIVTTG